MPKLIHLYPAVSAQAHSGSVEPLSKFCYSCGVLNVSSVYSTYGLSILESLRVSAISSWPQVVVTGVRRSQCSQLWAVGGHELISCAVVLDMQCH